jgi:hypothetical protein
MQELPLQPDSVAARRTELRRPIEALELHKVLTPEQLKEVEQKGVEISEVAALAHAARVAARLTAAAPRDKEAEVSRRRCPGAGVRASEQVSVRGE